MKYSIAHKKIAHAPSCFYPEPLPDRFTIDRLRAQLGQDVFKDWQPEPAHPDLPDDRIELVAHVYTQDQKRAIMNQLRYLLAECTTPEQRLIIDRLKEALNQ